MKAGIFCTLLASCAVVTASASASSSITTATATSAVTAITILRGGVAFKRPKTLSKGTAAVAAKAPTPPELEKTGRLFSWRTLLRDHVRFVVMLPRYFSAYVVPGRALAPTTIEAVMVTVNSLNTCPYCTGLHGELARMAGVVVEQSDPAVRYAKTFALEAGRGPKVDAAYDKLASTPLGPSRAKSVQSLCCALLWGKTTGNSINAARDKVLKFRWASVTLLDVFILAYYGPLFFVIGLLNEALKIAPKIPPVVSAGIGAVLWVPQALNILPLGLVSVVLHLLGVV
jgi:AhpD family alkylhydroperoxidase